MGEGEAEQHFGVETSSLKRVTDNSKKKGQFLGGKIIKTS